MENAAVVRLIDAGANTYLRLLGEAPHMELIQTPFYAIIRPQAGEEGATVLFDIRLEHLADEEIAQKVAEIQQLGLHTWWGISQSERVLKAIWKGQPRPASLPEPNGEEANMALRAGEMAALEPAGPDICVRRVSTLEEFQAWAEVCNRVLHGGYRVLHPIHHYGLCQSGAVACYSGYYQGQAASAAAIFHSGEIYSLEFVATLPELQRKGLGKAVCARAVAEAFQSGAGLITLRSSPEAKKLYASLGFRFISPD